MRSICFAVCQKPPWGRQTAVNESHSKFKISAARPSEKYSFSLSALILAKGRTAMEG